MIFLHIDVDNLWVYEEEFGIKILPNKEYIYTKSLPVLLKLLKKTNSKATFMIIGKDLKLKTCRSFCKKAVSKGHEIANHTWSHPVSFGKLSFEEKKIEIIRAHQIITESCGKKPIGFRGAGYYQDNEIIEILKKLGYKYDSSVLPGFAKTFMNTYAFLRGKENRHKTFGRLNYLFALQNPFEISYKKNQTLKEFPISVFPFIRLPIHTTFAYFFGRFYEKLILKYIKSKPKYFLYLFHAIDFVDLQRKDKKSPIIALRYSFKERLRFLEDTLDALVEANGKPLQTTAESF